jgi:hypothetical protein
MFNLFVVKHRTFIPNLRIFRSLGSEPFICWQEAWDGRQNHPLAQQEHSVRTKLCPSRARLLARSCWSTQSSLGFLLPPRLKSLLVCHYGIQSSLGLLWSDGKLPNLGLIENPSCWQRGSNQNLQQNSRSHLLQNVKQAMLASDSSLKDRQCILGQGILVAKLSSNNNDLVLEMSNPKGLLQTLRTQRVNWIFH